jgi:YkoY family integral membrane protein
MFHQTFDIHDLIIVGLLIVLEGVLSIDNALVLGLLAKRLPRQMQGRALTYGLIGAFVFRVIAIGTASYLLHWRIVKLLGGAYLVYVAVKHFFFEGKKDDQTPAALTGGDANAPAPAQPWEPTAAHARFFWQTVMMIELTDIAFAVDSIVAAIGVVGPPPKDQRHPKLWVVLVGGMLGVILMRFAAVIFIRLLERFPRFETAAYLLVIVIGGKLIADWALNSEANPHAVDFHNPRSAAFWVFWLLMVGSFCLGFIPKRTPSEPPPARSP